MEKIRAKITEAKTRIANQHAIVSTIVWPDEIRGGFAERHIEDACESLLAAEENLEAALATIDAADTVTGS